MRRFAFYGRVSTEDQQDPAPSRQWQLRRAEQLIEPAGGTVVEEFFYIGLSRSVPWKRRPAAASLIDTFKNPRRGFDAVVIGEPQRAFYGNQFGLTFPVFVHYGIALWVPEVGGAVDPGSDAHDLVMSLYGGMSKGERNRIKIRVRSAMSAQAAAEGRFLGGRPPYGYVLVDAGVHPNPGKAAHGQQLRRLEIDPAAAPVVARIFSEWIDGAGLQRIAVDLNADSIPSPSGHDPSRNLHRASGRGLWSKSAIRAIVLNPRYTGHQVWNRQRRDEILIDVEDVALGHETRMRWNERRDWIWSEQPSHDPIVSVDEYEAAQRRFGTGKRSGGGRNAAPGRRYVLRGMLRCGLCGRRMQGQWSHDRPHYRCRFTAEYPAHEDEHPRNVYVREDAILPALDAWLATLFDPTNLDATCDALSEASRPGSRVSGERRTLTGRLSELERRLSRYREALAGNGDATEIAGWIAETQRERDDVRYRLESEAPTGELNRNEARELVESFEDINRVIADADPADKAALYKELGIDLTYGPDGRILVEARPRRLSVCVGGGT